MATANSDLLGRYTNIVRQWLQSKDLSGGKTAEWPLPWLLKVDSATRWALYQRFIDLGYGVSEVSSGDMIYMLVSRN